MSELFLIGKTINYWSLDANNKKLFFCFVYKMVLKIRKETWENNDIEVIVENVNALWLNEKNTEEKLGHKNIAAITNKYDKI